jgi:predicted PurR-regulated permease PerM
MEVTEKDIKRFSLVLIFLVLVILMILVVRPVLMSIFAGLILAYIFSPIYKIIVKTFKNKTLSAALVSILVIALIAVPLWFLVPIMIEQVFELFQYSQNLDISGAISQLLPGASPQLITQTSLTITSAVNKLTSATLNSLVEFLLNFPVVSMHLLLVCFVFFFALRDLDQLKEYALGLSPLNKTQEKHLVDQFKGITDSIVYGQILLGLIQGILVGIGLLVFGVPNTLILTVAAVILGVLPVIGPGLVYLPVAIYLLIAGNPASAIVFLLYNILIVSTIDNIGRAHIVSRKTDLSQVVVLVGMIGGLFVFGVLGLILGPLILAYFLVFLRAYKDKNLSSLFN